jgi:Fe-S cluster assembly protein SufB
VPVVEIVVRAGGRCTYTSLQNWTKNVFNLVAKRARVEKGGAIRWIDADLGSRWNRKHPAADLLGRGARAEVFSIALAGAGQREDLGARIVHAAPATESRVLARSLARAGGRATFRARIEVRKEARGARVASRCDALILDEPSAAETLPDLDVRAPEATVEHEGAVSRIADDRLYYLESRGIPPEEAEQLIVNGFVAPVVRELPVEYAVEVGRLLAAELQGARRAS